MKTEITENTLISECDLSIRTKNLFENAGLITVGDILKHKLSDLMKYRNFGAKSLSELRGFVIKNNLSFDNN